MSEKLMQKQFLERNVELQVDVKSIPGCDVRVTSRRKTNSWRSLLSYKSMQSQFLEVIVELQVDVKPIPGGHCGATS